MSPLLTFVLAVHREQAYVRECAASILDQPFTDLELIAIDDASPDHVPELLDELAERDARVRVRHLPARAGLGEARNLALAEASGDYVWFVDATDRLPPGSLAAVVERLREQAPDVLVVPHSRTGPLRRTKPGPHGKLLARVAERDPAPLDQRPALTRTAPGVWSKVFRRTLLDGLRFGRGEHGELAVTWPALLAADRIAAASDVAYDRRTPGNELRDQLAVGSPFDVFAAYDTVFEHAAAAPDARRRLVLPAMLRHQLALLERVPEGERREFFHRMSECYRRHRRGDEPRPGGRGGRLRARLVERDAWTAFRLLDRVRDRRGRPKRRRERALDPHYRAALEQPIDPDLAVFAAYWYRGYSCNPRAIYERARELVPGMRGVWVVDAESADAMPPGVEHVVAGTPEYWDTIARARWFVNNVNFPNHLVKRDGQVHVMTHHGTPLKRMGLDNTGAYRAGGPPNLAAMLRRCARWDFSVTQNAFTTLIWERTYPVRCETLEVGYPRNDVLANAGEEEVQRLRAELGIERGKRAVMYAPTHREYESQYVPRLDLAGLADALGPDYVIMARLHYFHDSDPVLRELHREGRVRDVAAHPAVEELCLAADALITDYSSIMFDYAVLDRPIVIHAPDWDTYRARRGTYFDLMAEPPGSVATTEEL